MSKAKRRAQPVPPPPTSRLMTLGEVEHMFGIKQRRAYLRKQRSKLSRAKRKKATERLIEKQRRKSLYAGRLEESA